MSVGYIRGFNGIRGLAVLFVIASHVELFQSLSTSPHTQLLASIFSAEIGVRAFFVLSGFLITHLLISEHEISGKIDLKKFYLRRILRIWPVYLIAVAFLLVLNWVSIIRLEGPSIQYLLLHSYNLLEKQYTFHAASHFWSLSVEEHFYLLWPAFMLVFLRKTKFGFLALSILMLALLKEFLFPTIFSTYSNHYYTERWTFPAAFPILAGAAWALITKNCSIERFLVPGPGLVGLALLFIGSGLFYSVATHTEYVPLLQIVGMCLLITLIVKDQDSSLVKFLSIKPLEYIGKISYGLYVWQGIFTGNGPYRLFSEFPPTSLVLGLWLTFTVSIVSYELMERPLERLRAKYR